MTDVLEVSPVNTEEYRLLHTMIRVTDIDKSIARAYDVLIGAEAATVLTSNDDKTLYS